MALRIKMLIVLNINPSPHEGRIIVQAHNYSVHFGDAAW